MTAGDLESSRMGEFQTSDLIALDVGNSRLKAGRFGSRAAIVGRLPEPVDVLGVSLSDPLLFDALAQWLAALADRPARWIAASVNDRALARLTQWFAKRGIREIACLTDPDRLGLHTTLAAPECAGIDRLLNAVAANVVRPEGKPAVVVDVGSAVTVDVISADGVFLGGAIFPGIGLAARALAEFTEKLPLLDVVDILRQSPPELPGTSTPAAMSAGLFWSLVGGVRELVTQTAARLAGEPMPVLTGGGSEPLVSLLGRDAMWLPHLTLQGIWQADCLGGPSLAASRG